MIKIEHVEVFGWEHAIRGMRNPMNSWAKSDSKFVPGMLEDEDHYIPAHYEIGPNDLKLMKRLSKGNGDDRKFMRDIIVYLDITAPLYWWKEFDTYKVGTVANSCSTMHKIHAKEFTPDDFSHEHLIDFPDFAAITVDGEDFLYSPKFFIEMLCEMLNYYRKLYLETKDKKYWWQMIQLLPASYNQKRTVMLNYEVLRNMYVGRANHKLDEWKRHNNVSPKILGEYYRGEYDLVNKNALEGVGFCDWIRTLPYSELITGEEKQVFENAAAPGLASGLALATN